MTKALVPEAKAPPRLADLSPAALAKPAKGPTDLRALFEDPRTQEQLARVLPEHMKPERLLKVALSCVLKTPALLKCSQVSLLQSVMALGELGLELGSALGLAYLVPYGSTATPIIGYRGYIELARRSGTLTQIEARTVRAKDKLELRFGLDPRLEHTPSLEQDPGQIELVYGVARFKDGGVHFEMMTRTDIERIRGRSRAGNSGPWQTDWEEMAKKTVIRRMAKWLPLSPELARASELESESETVEGVVSRRESIGASAFELPPVEEQDPPPAGDAQTQEAEDIVEATIRRQADELREAIMAATSRKELQALAGKLTQLPGPERESLAQFYAQRAKEVSS